jgi:hypothetical protein
VARRADNSTELNGSVTISRDDRTAEEIILAPLVINNEPEYDSISLKCQLVFETGCVVSESEYSIHKKTEGT